MASSGAFCYEFLHWTACYWMRDHLQRLTRLWKLTASVHNFSLISKSSIRITRETSILSLAKKLRGLVGGLLLVGGLGPGPPGPSPKSGTELTTPLCLCWLWPPSCGVNIPKGCKITKYSLATKPILASFITQSVYYWRPVKNVYTLKLYVLGVKQGA